MKVVKALTKPVITVPAIVPAVAVGAVRAVVAIETTVTRAESVISAIVSSIAAETVAVAPRITVATVVTLTSI